MAVRKPANGKAVDEDRLDQMIDDSFPASDPPSFTPVAHLGKPPEDEIDDFPGDDGGRHWYMKAALGAIAVGAVLIFVTKALRGRKKKRSRFSVPMPESAGSILQPLASAAQSGREAVAQAGKDVARRAAA